jgi:hypothetical protein
METVVARPLKDSPYRRDGRIIIGDRTIDGLQYRRRATHETKAAAGLALKVLNIAAAKDDFRWLMREPWDPEPYMRILEGLPPGYCTSNNPIIPASSCSRIWQW